MISQEDYDDEAEAKREERRVEQRYENLLARHPRCSDPEHPGCEDCREGETA